MSLKTMKDFDFYLYHLGKISYQTANYKTKPGKQERTRDQEADKIFKLLQDGDITKIVEAVAKIQEVKKIQDKLNN